MDEIPPEVWNTKEFDDTLLRYCNAVYNQNTTDKERPRNNQELPKYNPYIHSGQGLQCSTTQPHRT